MERYKLCPGCGTHNNPLAIECEQCGEDLSSVRIVDAVTEEQTHAPAEKAPEVRMVRVCEECGAKNDPQLRKCAACGEDISFTELTPDTEAQPGFALASLDGEYSFPVPCQDEPVVIGREHGMQEHLKTRLYVSRRHAELLIDEGVLLLRSFSEAVNGSHINGVAVMPGVTVRLAEGDIVGLGGNDPQTQPEAAYFRVVVR